MNQENYRQTIVDLHRLFAQIRDLERMEAQSIEGIRTQNAPEIHSAEASLEQETSLYNDECQSNGNLPSAENVPSVQNFASA